MNQEVVFMANRHENEKQNNPAIRKNDEMDKVPDKDEMFERKYGYLDAEKGKNEAIRQPGSIIGPDPNMADKRESDGYNKPIIDGPAGSILPEKDKLEGATQNISDRSPRTSGPHKDNIGAIRLSAPESSRGPKLDNKGRIEGVKQGIESSGFAGSDTEASAAEPSDSDSDMQR